MSVYTVMLIDIEKKYRTRDGRPARILSTNKNPPYPVVALIKSDVREDLVSYTDTGMYHDGGEINNYLDLIEVKEDTNAMIEMNKTYRTRSGKPARVLCVDSQNEQNPVVALIQDSPEEEYVTTYSPDGRFLWDEEGVQHPYDLIEDMEPVKTEVNEIDKTKTYRTRGGSPVRILCVDAKDPLYPVLALIEMKEDREFPASYTKDGFYLIEKTEHEYDLFEYNAWADFKVDEPVLVRDSEEHPWVQRHFAGVKHGKPATWIAGGTSWTSQSEFRPAIEMTNIWNFCKKASST